MERLKSMKFEDIFNKTMGIEGGYVDDPDDRGGETYKGISRKNHPAWEGWEIIDSMKEMEHSVFPENLETMIKKIQAHPFYIINKPKIHIVSPPPYGKDENMLEKYHGGTERIAWLYPRFKEIANKNNCNFIDVYSKLLPNWDYYAKEGIHPTIEGQMIIARTISSAID